MYYIKEKYVLRSYFFQELNSDMIKFSDDLP